jgi:hypothetical protein
MRFHHGKGKVLLVVLTLAMVGMVLFFAGRYFLYVKVKNTIEYELGALGKQGIFVTYENLEVYPWDGKIEAHEITVKVRKDSLSGDSTSRGLDAYLPYVTIEGIELIPFIKEKTISVHKIHSYETYLTYRINSTLFEQDKSQRRKIEVQNISVQQVNFPRIDFYLTSELENDTVAHIMTDVEMRRLFLAKQLDSLTWKKGNVKISNFALNYKKENYGFSCRQIRIEIGEKSMALDSFRVKPLVGREAFMRQAGKQSSYLDAVVPYLMVKSIDWYTFPTATLQVDRLELSLYASMYRDKRLPFDQPNDRALPAHFLQRIPIKIKVDTVNLRNSYVRYEEMPEDGDSTGVVFFDQLNANILNMHNDRKLKVDAKMHASARFMGIGDLNAYFTFPFDTTHQYRIEGTLKSMPLVRLNNILGSAAKIRIESGVMQNMNFRFAYNNERSEGQVELNYEDLKILSLRQNKQNQQSVSRIKTLLLNIFIIRKDLDEDSKDDRRKGQIAYTRHTKKSVINYWWKSILSGIKSAYNLDKLPLNAVAGEKKKDGKKKKDVKGVFSKIFQ